MSRFEDFEGAAFRPALQVPPTYLPFHVEPQPEEALISWLRRLATLIGISTHALVHHVFGMRAPSSHLQWWRRPDPILFVQIEQRVRISRQRLRAMTFSDWPAHVRDEDATERLSANRFLVRPPKRRHTCHIVVCSECFNEDHTPYLRLTWTLGWMAICPRHATILTRQCPACRMKLRLPAFNSTAAWRADRCSRCNATLVEVHPLPAHPAVLRLQAAFLFARSQGSGPLPGLGTLSWPLALAAADVMLSMMWTAAYQRHREKLCERIRQDMPQQWQPQIADWGQRYGSLTILAWLLERWPRYVRAASTILQTPRFNTLINGWQEMDAPLRESLRAYLGGSVPKRPIERAVWHPWLDRLTCTSGELRARARHEPVKHRHFRLLVLAQLREGHSPAEVAEAAGLWPRAIYRWLRIAALRGLDTLLQRGTERSRLTRTQAAEIVQWLDSLPEPATPGFRLIRAGDVVLEVWARFGIEIPIDVGWKIIGTHGKWPGYRCRQRPVRALRSRIRNSVHG